MEKFISNLTLGELKILRQLRTPEKIQDFLNGLPLNWEPNGDTCNSPRIVLRENRAHCIEGAFLAALTLWLNGLGKPFLFDLRATDDDFDHVVTLFKRDGCWGAISKTNHAVLRYREPIYKTLRELALSYFHEYFENKTGKKVLREYSRPFDLSKVKKDWITTEEPLFWLAEELDDSPHFSLLTKKQIRHLRPAEKVERKAGEIIEWQKSGKVL